MVFIALVTKFFIALKDCAKISRPNSTQGLEIASDAC